MEVGDTLTTREMELVRQSFADLRVILARTPAKADKAALLGLCARLVPDGWRASVLSSREVDVLAHAATGCRNKEIAHLLHIEASTVKSYLCSAMNKLGATSRHEAVVAARRAGVLP